MKYSNSSRTDNASAKKRHAAVMKEMGWTHDRVMKRKFHDYLEKYYPGQKDELDYWPLLWIAQEFAYHGWR